MTIFLKEKYELKDTYEKNKNFWYIDNLIKITKNLPIKTMKVDKKFLNKKIKESWTLNTFFDLKIHIEKINKANLKYPIIIDSKNNIIDGKHRIMKAILQNKKIIKFVRINKMPPADFKY